MFTPERSTKVSLVLIDSYSKGHDGFSLNDYYLDKDPDFINSLLSVLAAWRWNEVACAFTGEERKIFNQILSHIDDQMHDRFLWTNKTSDPPNVYP